MTANVQAGGRRLAVDPQPGPRAARQGSKKTIIVRSNQNQPFKLTELKSKQRTISGRHPARGGRPTAHRGHHLQGAQAAGPYNAVCRDRTDLKDEPPAKLSTFATIVP